MSRIMGAVAATLLVVSLTGCYSQGHHPEATAQASDIVGTWVAEQDSGTDATITFDGDGTFVATAYPKVILCAAVGTDAADGHGTWALDDGHDVPPRPRVALDWIPEDVADGNPCETGLDLEEIEGELLLFSWIGDPDLAEDVTFVRQT
jgi:hypothetical protein